MAALCSAATLGTLGCGQVRQSPPSKRSSAAESPAEETRTLTKIQKSRSVAVQAAAVEATAPTPALDPHHLAGPSLEGWTPVFDVEPGDRDADDSAVVAVATELEVPLYPQPGARHAIGYTYIGNRLVAEAADDSCSGGEWYRVTGGAYLCTGDGAQIVPASSRQSILDSDDRSRRPRLDEAVPFDYAKAGDDDPPRLERLPTAEELEGLADGDLDGDLLERWMKGAYLLALARKAEVAGEEFYETVEGHYVRVADVVDKPTPPLNDGVVSSVDELPLAFAVRDTALFIRDGDDLEERGTVEKHARFSIEKEIEIDGSEWVLLDGERAVLRKDVRIVEQIERPSGVGSGDKWIHIHLTEQTLTAYEGDNPVYVTLVSSGKRGHSTHRGLYQVERKYLTKTMRGKDEDGRYVVEQVPWTMYYDGNYAVHGAYWHNRFGLTKSHGCVNVPPADARWLYFWADPDLPAGWHAMFHRLGTHVYITGETPDDGDEEA